MSRALPLALLIAATPLLAADQPGVGPAVEQEPFGQLPNRMDQKSKKMVPGEKITAFTLVNKNGVKAKVIDYGGILTSLSVPDKDGKFGDVVLGFDTLEGYLAGHPYFGSNVGRCANRIAKGKFTLEGKEYTLATNNGPNALHGGAVGFDKKYWRAEPVMGAAGPGLKLSYTSPAGEEGYPGTLSATVEYTLTHENELKVEYTATSDKPTLCNLAHHSYFNLAGHGSGDILGHKVEILAKNYTPTDDTLIPTGKITPVAGTPFDFTKPTAIGERIKETGGTPTGYDLNYVLDGKGQGGVQVAARVVEPKTGRTLTVSTTEPGLQFYSGNFLDGSNKGKGGAVYKQYNGFCMEAQKFPDSVNRKDWWATSNPVLRPGETYRATTVYKFGVAK